MEARIGRWLCGGPRERRIEHASSLLERIRSAAAARASGFRPRVGAQAGAFIIPSGLPRRPDLEFHGGGTSKRELCHPTIRPRATMVPLQWNHLKMGAGRADGPASHQRAHKRATGQPPASHGRAIQQPAGHPATPPASRALDLIEHLCYDMSPSPLVTQPRGRPTFSNGPCVLPPLFGKYRRSS
jgi:hypothetical protein